jgi:hypothetical protein
MDEQQQSEYQEVLNELSADIELGNAARDFFESPIGRYLLDCAIKEQEQAFREWRDIDPSDALAIQKCQMQSLAPSLVFAWLNGAVTTGDAALEQANSYLEEGIDQ